MKQKLNALLEKYQERNIECEERFDEDVLSLKINDNTEQQIEWLNADIQSLNIQLGIYECILRDNNNKIEMTCINNNTDTTLITINWVVTDGTTSNPQTCSN